MDKYKMLMILVLATSALAMESCDGLWDEHCIYTGYLEGHITMADSTLQAEDFRLAYYPMSGQGMGTLDGKWDRYGTACKAGRLVNIGSYHVLSYCPGDFELLDTASLTGITLEAHHGWDTVESLELITANRKAAASSWGAGDVDIDDTTRVEMAPTLMTQHLRINIHLLKVPDGSDFRPVTCLLSGIASRKRLYDHTLTGSYFSLKSQFARVDSVTYRMDTDLLGTAGAPDHLLRLCCTAGGEEHRYSYDLDRELRDWTTPYREIDISMKVGDSMDKVEIDIMGWIDKQQGDFPMLNE